MKLGFSHLLCNSSVTRIQYKAQSSAIHHSQKVRFHTHKLADGTVFLFKTEQAVTLQSGKGNGCDKSLNNCT